MPFSSIFRRTRQIFSRKTKSPNGSVNSVNTSSTQGLSDEYGVLDSSGDIFVAEDFTFECGTKLRNVEVCYNSFGSLNEAKDNAIVVCHALTGNSRLDQWWGSMLGPGRTIDTDKYFVVCANIVGSCYGSTGPRSINPENKKPYGNSFPEVTIRDTVSLHLRLAKEHLKIASIACVIGGSMGGMQALEWAFLGSTYVRAAVVIGCGAQHTAWQIGISETQRQAIYADPKWNNGNINFKDPPTSGLSVARQIAMVSYRTAFSYHNKFGRELNEGTLKDSGNKWQVQTYLEYQGKKFLERFDALTYVRLTNQMDSHDVGRNRGGIEAALKSLKQPIMVMAMTSDILYPLSELTELAEKIPNSEFKTIDTVNGHDGFLLEQQQVGDYITKFLSQVN